LFLEVLRSIPEQLSIHTLHLYLQWLLPQGLDAINMFLKALGPSLESFACDSDDGMFIPCTTIIKLF
jgi:hypothetical protein